jgi:hypothetical protein
MSLFGNIAAATESGAKAHITVVATSGALHPIFQAMQHYNYCKWL